jgi:uncharacterized protein (DUF1501 family)
MLADAIDDLARSLAAFVIDLGQKMDDVVVITMSEFGRTASENGTRGTEHGHAGSLLLLGGGVRGGKVYGKWPGLAREQLHDSEDLALTTDIRIVLAEVLQRHLGASDIARVFPGLDVRPGEWLSIMTDKWS